ncbi:sigma-70 family RNA polymerase sigma factor [Enterocloster alcoholdehydrogenati]|uniref:sigma-70 family RNA polymerase sigma factor n=1 Tax=Enterocloster alcoholdehydrogenati TaxID=2547410 RepID=UPI001593C672|nr:sigma-70 family RNA polymerase sigma factor [Enterocloster alcoholdehydrogenati]
MVKRMNNERLCALAQQGDIRAQAQLIHNNLGYIRKTANELYISVGLGNSELGIDHDDLIQEGSIGLLRAISLYDPAKKIKFLTYAGPAVRNAMMDLISSAFATFEQRMQSDKDGIPMERINLDDLLPGEDSVQRSDLIADPYASEPEQMMVEEENRKELYEGLRRISKREQVYLLYRFGFEDDMEHPLVGTALHFHLSESRARSTEALALDNLWLELPWWY